MKVVTGAQLFSLFTTDFQSINQVRFMLGNVATSQGGRVSFMTKSHVVFSVGTQLTQPSWIPHQVLVTPLRVV